MEWIVLFALSVLVAIGFNFGYPRVAASTNPYAMKLQSSYAGKTLATALVFFLAIYAAAIVLTVAGERPSLP
jgi:branched-subunit amino acid permease